MAWGMVMGRVWFNGKRSESSGNDKEKIRGSLDFARDDLRWVEGRSGVPGSCGGGRGGGG